MCESRASSATVVLFKTQAYLFDGLQKEALIADMFARKPALSHLCCCPGSSRGQAVSGKYVAEIYLSTDYVTTALRHWTLWEQRERRGM